MKLHVNASAESLIIFDCDGVLVDSEVIACRVDAECLTEAGLRVTGEELYHGFVGMSAEAIGGELARRSGVVAPAGLNELRRVRIMEAFTRELRAMPGVERVLAGMSGRRCVASSSHPERVAHSLEVTGLREYFGDFLFSTSMVARGKPAPDIFLFAAEKMGAEAGGCIVIEDSPAGISGAKAAGMRAVGFTGGSHCRAGHGDKLRAAGADCVVGGMEELWGAMGL